MGQVNLVSAIAQGIRPRRFNTNLPLAGGTTLVYYKYRGYNNATLQYESWISTSEVGSPPSGNTLVDITRISSWTLSATST
jgi:hypothetical protein